MTNPSDISNLFKHIGASDADYQEISKQNSARESQSRWPLLASLHAQANRSPDIDTRKRFDVDTDVPSQPTADAASEQPLFAHMASDEDISAHEQAVAALAEPQAADLRASSAAMAAVEAAPHEAVPTPAAEQAPAKIAEFIAPRAKGSAGLLNPSSGRPPYVPEAVPASSAAPASATHPANPVTFAPRPANPVVTDVGPATRAAMHHAAFPAAVPVEPSTPRSVTSSVARPVTPEAEQAVSPQATPAAKASTAPLRSLFARLAEPKPAETLQAEAPPQPAAPTSLFDRLKRS